MPTLANNRPQPRQKVGAILLCAGRGERLGMDEYKGLVPLAGKPLFAWSLEALEQTADVDGIVVVGSRQRLQTALHATTFKFSKIVGWREGGRTRQESVALGLKTLPVKFTYVLIHDSARPLLTTELTLRVINDALEHGAAITAVPLEDTLKQAAGQTVSTTVARNNLWRAQTPQVFRRDWLETAHIKAVGEATDDATLVETLGHSVFITPGEASNFKITTREDLKLAETLLTHTKPPSL